MITQLIWWGSIALETLLLVRGLWGKIAKHYPVFYTYIGFVLVQSLLRFFVYQWEPGLYSYVYWITEMLGVIAGCAVVFELCAVALAAYPGTARMGRKLLAIVFLLVFGNAVLAASNDLRTLFANSADLERAVRAVQAVTILALVVLFLFYAIPFGKNLRGILIGYGLFVGMSTIQLTFVSAVGDHPNKFWSYLHPVSYDIALGVWVAHLWSYCANPEPRTAVPLEEQYQRVAAATSQRLREARGYLERAVRP
jgi:hypothetical protein